eukprot:362104-Chlamydomonas_euryale.AAC.8
MYEASEHAFRMRSHERSYKPGARACQRTPTSAIDSLADCGGAVAAALTHRLTRASPSPLEGHRARPSSGRP